MPKAPITTFSSVVIKESPTNTNNGLYTPELTQEQIDKIPQNALKNGAIVYNTTDDNFQIYEQNDWEIINTSEGDVSGPNFSVVDNIATFSNTAGSEIEDSGVSITRVPALLLANKFRTKKVKAPLVDINEIGNLGHLKFVNDIGLIFVDGLMPVEFIVNDFGLDSQVSSLFTGGLPSSSTTPSALVELQTTTGALLLSRLTTAERDDVDFFPTPGMILYNIDTNKFNLRDNLSWKEVGDVFGAGSSTLNNIASFSDATGKALKDSGIDATTIYYPGNPTYFIDTYSTTNNFFAGTNAGNNTMSGVNNVSIGGDSLTSNTTGSQNLAVGVSSLTSNTTGSQNLAVGQSSLRSNTTAFNNLAVGQSSLYSNTTGSQNLAVGVSSLTSNTTGFNNLAVGASSLFSNTTGFHNLAVGVSSLRSNTTAFNNLAVGASSLFSNTTGSQNLAVGELSLYSNTTGSQNLAVGQLSLFSNTGSGNVGLGYNSASFFSYTNCLFLGYDTDALSSGLTNAAAIGYNAKVGSSNSIVLGSNCFVGIGKSSPAYSLHLGTDNSSIPLIYITSSSVPAAPGVVNDGIFSVTSGLPKFTSGTSSHTGTLVTATTNLTSGTATLDGTTGITVATGAITTSSTVLVTRNSGAALPSLLNVGTTIVGSIINGTSFTVYSTNGLDTTATVNWMIINA